MKKKIFIYSYNLGLGGIERSLIGLLQAINYDSYDVDLFLLKHEGELMSLIPKQVNLLPEVKKSEVFGISILNAYKKGYFFEASVRLYAKIKGKIVSKKHKNVGEYISNIYHKIILNKFPKQTKEYDIALGFSFPHYYIQSCVKAKKYIGWIHTDYSKVYIRKKEVLPMFKKLDYVATISESAGESLCRIMPELVNKMIIIENILSKDFIIEHAEQFNIEDEMQNDENIKFLSVGRFCYQKNFENIPFICKQIIEKGYNIKWYIIGFGSYEDEQLIKQKITEAGMENNVIILGKKDNPYPYMKSCDYYVQPSRYEGKAVTVREAQILCKPVIITDFPTAKSQLTDGVDGFIVPLDNELCAEGIIKVISDKDKISKVTEFCKNNDYTNCTEIEKIYNIIK